MSQSVDEPGTPIADWRHLGVMPRGGRALLIGGSYPELSSVFDVTEIATLGQIPQPPHNFQLIVVCTGLESTGSVAAVKAVLDSPAGVVVVLASPLGRSGRLGRSARSTRRILRGTGLKVEGVFGALPGAHAPEYVFPLGRAAAAFAIERFVLSRRPSWLWIRTALSFGPVVGLATSALPEGYILCGLDGAGS